MKKILAAMLLSAAAFTGYAQNKTVTTDANDAVNSNNKLVIRNSFGQSFFTGWQSGSTYSFNQGIFRAVTDNPYGPANLYYDGVTNGVTNFFVRADGQGYFGGNVIVGPGSNSGNYGGYSTLSLRNATNGGVVDFWQGGTLTGLVVGDAGGLSLNAQTGYGIHFGTSNGEVMNLSSIGNLGLGLSAGTRLEVASGTNGRPAVLLHQTGGQAWGHILTLVSDNPNGGDDPRMLFSYRVGAKRWALGGYTGTDASNSRFSVWEDAGDGIYGGGFGTERFTVLPGGNVGIGTAVPDALLAVKGTIHAQQVKVDMNGWNDAVFYASYRLRPLDEVKAYVDRHHHLPEVPSEAEVLKNGQDLGQMNNILLKKVEELTLYVMKQQEQINKLNKHIRNHSLKQHTTVKQFLIQR